MAACCIAFAILDSLKYLVCNCEFSFKDRDGVNKPHFSISTKSKMSKIKQVVPYQLKKQYAINISDWNIVGMFIISSIQPQSWICLSGGGNIRLHFSQGDRIYGKTKNSSSKRLWGGLTSEASPLDV